MLTSLTTGISDYATRRAIQQLASKLNHDSKPTFAGLTINGESVSDALITQWSTAYSWGDHAGLYDAIGTAEGEVSDHEATYDHTLLHNPVTLGTANGLTLNDQELSLPTTAAPTLAGLTLTGMSGVVKTTAGVFSGSATLDDMADGTNYERVAATELSSGVYKNATTTVKGIASFSSTNFSVTDGAVSLATGGGLTHNDLGSLQGGTAGEYYHFTSADYAKIANWDTAYGWGDHSAGGYFVKASDDLDDVTAGTTNVHLTTTLKTSYDGAASHKTTEDAINGLVSCNGTGTYSAKAIGTDVQAYSSLLAAIAGLTPTDGNIVVGNGSTWVAESGATARTSLGLGTTDSPTFTSLALTATAGVPFDSGGWIGRPDPISTHSNILGSLFCGDDGENVGRIAIGSNANHASLQYNRYFDGTNSQQSDSSRPSYQIILGTASDYIMFGRSPAGSATIVPQLTVDGATSDVTIAGGLVVNTSSLTVKASTSSVGIGTASPARQLHIAHASLPYLHMTDDVSGHTATDGLSIGLRGTGYLDAIIRLRENRPLSFWTNDTVRMTVLASGEVGINTTTPHELLEVAGTIRTNDVFNVNGTDGVSDSSAGVPTSLTLSGGIATAITRGGGAKFGDGGTTDYSAFDASGQLTFAGDARHTNTMWLDAGALKAPGAKPATACAHGTLETPAFCFANEAVAGNQQTVSFVVRVPERMDRTVAPILHIGWSTTTTDPGDDSKQVKWQLEYLWVAEGEDTTAAAEETLTVLSSASTTAEGLVMSEVSGINTPSGTDLAMACRLTRLSADAADTVEDTVELNGVVFQWTSNRLGGAI